MTLSELSAIKFFKTQKFVQLVERYRSERKKSTKWISSIKGFVCRELEFCDIISASDHSPTFPAVLQAIPPEHGK